MSATGSADQQQDATPRGITEIAVQGFKSLYDEQRIKVRPLTILAGANNSGKSSIMQPLLMMKQTLDATYDPGPLKLDGPNVHFTSAVQFLSWNDGWPIHYDEEQSSLGAILGDRVNFTVKLGIHGGEWIASTFEYQSGRGIDIFEVSTSLWPDFSLRPDMDLSPDEISDAMRDIAKKAFPLAFSGRVGKTRISTYRNRCFLGLGIYAGPYTNMHDFLFSSYQQSLSALIHVPALKDSPRLYKSAGLDLQGRFHYEGTFDHYVASIIESWQDTQDDRLTELGRALKKLGLTWKIAARRLNDVEIELRAARLPQRQINEREDLVNIADMGVGVSQVLPALVALLTAIPGQLVYLEHPERDLHPRAQVALAQILADAARRGVRVVVETHSSLLLLGVQTLVAEGTLPPDHVALHWFERGDDGATEVESRELDEFGAYGDWPQDFADVELGTHQGYLGAVSKRRWDK